MHLRAVPRLGELAIFLGIFIRAWRSSTCQARTAGSCSAPPSRPSEWPTTSAASWALKLAGQGLAAGIAVHFGVYIDRFSFPVVGVHELPCAGSRWSSP